MSKTITIKGYVSFDPALYKAENLVKAYRILPSPYYAADTEIILTPVGIALDVVIPELNDNTLCALAVKTLRDKQNQAYNDYQRRNELLQSYIDRLKLIQYQPDSALDLSNELA